MKLIVGKRKWNYNPKMSPTDFFDSNEGNMSEDYLESYPQNGHLVNDGDLEHMSEWYGIDNLQANLELMSECYLVRLEENYL